MMGNGSASDGIRCLTEDKSNTNFDIQALLQEYVNDSGSIGAAVGFIDRGNVRFFIYGKKSVNGDAPISEETIFEIGSITKVFTTLALMDMVANYKVELDDPIETYLPGVKIPDMGGKRITLRHLAVHTSGMPRTPDNLAPKNLTNPYEDYTIENLYDYLNHYILKTSPGEQFEYSNIGMGLLGHILSLKAGQSYEQLIQSTICEKLGMTETVIALTPEMEERSAKGHHLRQEVGYWDIPSLAGAGALRSNIRDMTKFLAANMGLSDSPIVSIMEQCHREQFVLSNRVLSVGLGWILSHQDDHKIIWHNGATGGFRTYLGFNPKTQRGIVILSNSTEDWPDELGAKLLNPVGSIPPSS